MSGSHIEGDKNPRSGVTIGIDIGDKMSRYCVLDEAGEEIEEGSFNMIESAMRKARVDVRELYPVELRPAARQRDLVPIRVRDGLLRSRTLHSRIHLQPLDSHQPSHGRAAPVTAGTVNEL